MNDRVPLSLLVALAELSVHDASEALRAYAEGGLEERAEMLAFLESGGREQLRQLAKEHEDGTPTEATLREWLDSSHASG